MFGGVGLLTFQGLCLGDFPKWIVQIIYLAAVTFLKGFLATITLVQYTTKQLVQDTKNRKLRDITVYCGKKIKAALSSVTGNQLHETWYKSALKLNIECYCSRDENQTRNICESLAVSSQVVLRCTIGSH